MAAVSSPISLPPPIASLFFPRGFLLGLAAASAHSLFTCSMAASTTSSQSSAKPSRNWRPLSCAPAHISMWHSVASSTTATYSSSPSPARIGCTATRAATTNAKNSSFTSLSARSVMLCDIMSADPRSPLIPKDTNAFVGVESRHVIPHRLILSFMIHDIRGTRPFHSTSIFSTQSSPRSHLALVGFFIFLHDIFCRQVNECGLSIGELPIRRSAPMIVAVGRQWYRQPTDTALLVLSSGSGLPGSPISISEYYPIQYLSKFRLSLVSMARRYPMLIGSAYSILLHCFKTAIFNFLRHLAYLYQRTADMSPSLCDLRKNHFCIGGLPIPQAFFVLKFPDIIFYL